MIDHDRIERLISHAQMAYAKSLRVQLGERMARWEFLDGPMEKKRQLEIACQLIDEILYAESFDYGPFTKLALVELERTGYSD